MAEKVDPVAEKLLCGCQLYRGWELKSLDITNLDGSQLQYGQQRCHVGTFCFQRGFQHIDRPVVIREEWRYLVVSACNRMVVRRKCNDRVEKCLAVVVHRNLQEGRLQEVACVILESVVVM